VVINFSEHETVSPSVRVPADAIAKMGLDGGDRLRVKTLLGAKPEVDTIRASDLTEGGLEVTLEPHGIAVIALD